MDHVLILTRDQAYGRYLLNLSEQLDSDVKFFVKDPDTFNPKKFYNSMIILDQDEIFDNVLHKFRGKSEEAFIVLTDKKETNFGMQNCKVLQKPLDAKYFVQTVSERLDTKRIVNDEAKNKGKALESLFVGSSPAIQEIRSNILRISDTDLSVLIQGETGTGKGVVARSLHSFSSRSENSYIEINCANVPPTLLESELFGYKQGAFTGAWKDKLGKFQLATNGTVFLDEVSEMSPHMQAKLLQVLQEGEFSPVGSIEDIMVDIRVIAATNAELKELIAQSRFRSDLYYRLAVISLLMPPLRERKSDIELLTTYFLEKYCRFYEKKSIRISDRLKAIFDRYQWPGNVRELENMIKTLVVMESEELVLDELQLKMEKSSLGSLYPGYAELYKDHKRFSLKEVTESAVKKAEKQLIDKAITKTRGNKKLAAELLSISYKSLLNKTKIYGI